MSLEMLRLQQRQSKVQRIQGDCLGKIEKGMDK
jgi:hypothetical protein